MSFFTTITFAVLVIIMLPSGVSETQETKSQSTDSAPPTSDEKALSPLHVSSSYMPLHNLPYAATDAPPPYTP